MDGKKKKSKRPIKKQEDESILRVKELTDKDLSLYCASEQGDIDKVYQLLWDKANVNSVMPHSGCTSLMAACKNGHTSLITLLIEFGANVEMVDDYSCSAMHWAANSGDLRLAVSYFKSGNSYIKRKATAVSFWS